MRTLLLTLGPLRRAWSRPSGSRRRLALPWLGYVASEVGSDLAALGLGMHFYELHASPLIYGLLLMAQMVPGAVLGLVWGSLLDRLGGRRVLLAGGVGAGLSSVLALGAAAAGVLSAPLAVGLVGLGATLNALSVPAFELFMAERVAAEELDRAFGLLEVGDALVLVVVPLVAGALVVEGGLLTLLALDALSFGLVVLGVACSTPRRAGSAALSEDSEGRAPRPTALMAELLGHPELGRLLVFEMVFIGVHAAHWVLVMPLVLATADEQALGAVLSAGGLGMLAGALWVTARGSRWDSDASLGALSALQGVALCVAVLHPSLFTLGLTAAVAMCTVPLLGPGLLTRWERAAEPRVLGSALALHGSALTLSYGLAYALAGLLGAVAAPALGLLGALSLLNGLVLAAPRLHPSSGRTT